MPRGPRPTPRHASARRIRAGTSPVMCQPWRAAAPRRSGGTTRARFDRSRPTTVTRADLLASWVLLSPGRCGVASGSARGKAAVAAP